MGKADFDIIVEDQRVIAGTTLRGAVYMDVTKQIAGSRLMVRLSGEEKVVVQYDEGDWSRRKMIPEKMKPLIKNAQSAISCFEDDNNRYQRRHRKEARVEIISMQVPIGTDAMIANKKIESGKYKLPFEIELPPSLPPTISLSNEEGRCDIEYSIEAHLEGSGWFNDYKASRNVYMQAKPATDDEASSLAVPYEGPPQTMPIKMGYCVTMGDMTYGCQMDNTTLVAGKTTTINMACLNQSTLGVASVKADLVQITSWEAGGFESEHEKVISTQTFPEWEDLQPISKEELEAQTATQGARDMSTIHTQIHTELQSGAHKVTVRIPATAKASYEGQIMSIKHELRLSLVSIYMFDFVAPCPKIDIPIQLLGAVPNTTMPDFDLPCWAADPANFIIAAAVIVPLTAMSYSTHVLAEQAEAAASGPIPQTQGDPSLENLLDAMKKTSNHLGLINQKTLDPEWKPVFCNLTQEQFGTILKQVHQDFQKSNVAVKIALQYDNNFTCAHAVSAGKASPEWMRAGMISRLVPFVKDLEENQQILVTELSDWERLVLEDKLAADKKASTVSSG